MRNQKGFTTVEVLVCFIVVSVICMSLFSVVSDFNDMRIRESYRSRVYEFKNEITNMIQEDIVKRGLTYAKIQDRTAVIDDSGGQKYEVDMTFRDGTEKKLIIYEKYTKTTYRTTGGSADDEFYIEYGPDDDRIRYELPDLGETKWYVPAGDDSKIIQAQKSDDCKAPTSKDGCRTAKDLQMNTIDLSISNEKNFAENAHVLRIYIGLYHPDLGTRYAINIVAPINYAGSATK